MSMVGERALATEVNIPPMQLELGLPLDCARWIAFNYIHILDQNV